jgi:GMP synthase-like glutamine amidotransferase
MSGKKAVIFQHVENEPAGIIEDFLAGRGVPFEYVKLYETGEVPEIEATHLVFMGGPMSVNDEQDLPWLAQEKALIRESVKLGRPVLGICLGAQLIAGAFGGRVYPFITETGWHPVRRVGDGPLALFPESFRVFQLHGETFEIPSGGILLCTGEEVRHQAFSVGSALGLQFHLELTKDLIADWTRSLPSAEREKIAAETPKFLARSNALCRMLAEDFFQ